MRKSSKLAIAIFVAFLFVTFYVTNSARLDYVVRAHIYSGMEISNIIKGCVSTQYKKHNDYDKAQEECPLTDIDKIKPYYEGRNIIIKYDYKASYDSAIGERLVKGELVIQPIFKSDGSISGWSCDASSLYEKYKPKNCTVHK